MTDEWTRVQRDEERYRLIFDSAIVGMYLSTREGRCIAANPALARILGFASAQELVETVQDARHQVYRDPAARDELMRRLDEHGFVDQYEWQGRRKDGSPVHLRQSATAIRDAGGTMTHVHGIIQDVTAQKQAQEELLAARTHLEYVLSMKPTVTYVHNLLADGRVTPAWTSDNVERLTGYTASECLAESWWPDHVHPGDLERARQKVRTLQDTGGAVVDYRFRHRDGSYRWMRDECRLVPPRQGGTPEIVGSWSDITDWKQEQAELERQRAALAQSQKLADMGTLLAGVAHELNNPLSILLGQAQLILREAGDGPLGPRAISLGHAADRCVRIVRNFLSLARQHAPERQHICLNQIARDAVELLAYTLRVDDVDITLDLAPILPSVWADPHQVHQVVVNLLTNAHHAARHHPGERRIRVTTGCRKDGVFLLVDDSGPGIPESLRGRVFEPFFTTKPDGEGTGLGLPLCRGIVEAHGGAIEALRSETLGGARMAIDLPFGSAGSPAHAVAAAPHRDAAALRILVVDDEEIVADVVAELLGDDGHATEVARGGLEAMRRLREADYDIVLTDIRMPVLDGISLFRAAQDLPSRSRPVFVFMTGDGLTPRTMEFLSEPGRIHLEKPFHADQVRATLRDAWRPHSATA
jgi:two-component system NtrC family sensor kinase